jgi:hypothetical protein
LCESSSVPGSSEFKQPLDQFYEAMEFFGEELCSDEVQDALQSGAKMFSWIDDDDSQSHFELHTIQNEWMDCVEAIASKTYARGLIFVTIYCENQYNVKILDGEGDQPLLDVKFPDFTAHVQGLQLRSYPDTYYSKLILWHSTPPVAKAAERKVDAPKVRLAEKKNVSGTGGYVQTYCVHKAVGDEAARNVIFRFGSWCYDGKVELGPSLHLADIPMLIPRLRMQQQQMQFTCEVTQMPEDSPYLPAMERIAQLSDIIQSEIVNAEGVLIELIAKSAAMGEDVSCWDEESDGPNYFFEFLSVPDPALAAVDIIASKVYVKGVVLVMIYCNGSHFVTVADGEAQAHALLDSRFPDVSCKSRGYQLTSYDENGVEGFQQLRKLSIWQVGAPTQEPAQPKTSQVPIVSTSAKEAKRKDAQVAEKPGPASASAAPAEAKADRAAETPQASSVSPVAEAAHKQEAPPTKNSLPHHIRPMSLTGKLPHEMLQATSKAPWDSTGKPLKLGFAKIGDL